MIDITHDIKKVVAESGVREGLCTVFIPHTTAGVTINENADPAVQRDMLMEINKIVPLEDGYKHSGRQLSRASQVDPVRVQHERYRCRWPAVPGNLAVGVLLRV